MKGPKVYSYDFSSDTRTLGELGGLLGKNRYEYCKKMKSEKAGLCSAYAFLTLRYALKCEYGMTEIPRFVMNEHGKPFLRDRPDIYFNISHASGRVLCAVSESPVGVDIQDIRKISMAAGRKFLTPSELERIGQITDDEIRYAELCRIWCIKESYGKFTGKGFGEGFSGFEADRLVENGQVRCTKKDEYYMSVCGEWEDEG